MEKLTFGMFFVLFSSYDPRILDRLGEDEQGMGQEAIEWIVAPTRRVIRRNTIFQDGARASNLRDVYSWIRLTGQ